MPEPIATQPNPAGTGAPEISDEQYMRWLDDMREFLRRGSTLWYAMDKAGILAHKTVIYKKYRLNDWFAEKIDALRSTMGELANEVAFRVLEGVRNRIIEMDGKIAISSEEVQVIKLVAEKHRTAQTFFVNRTETAEADESKVGKILDTLEATDYDQLGQQAQQQMVAPNPPVQDQGQVGQSSDVSPQPNATPAPSGEVGA